MAWTRWTFHDPNTNETYTLPINPNEGGDTSIDNPLGYQVTVAPDGAPVFFATQAKPEEMAWKGVFLDVTARNAMKAWARKTTQVLVTNDLGEQTWIWIDKLTITRKRVASRPYKADYDAHALVLSVP